MDEKKFCPTCGQPLKPSQEIADKKEGLLSQIDKAREKLVKEGNFEPYAVIADPGTHKHIVKECEKMTPEQRLEKRIVLSEKESTIFGLIFKMNAFLPNDRVMIIPKDMYTAMMDQIAGMKQSTKRIITSDN